MIPIFALISLALAAPINKADYTVAKCISIFTKARIDAPVCDYDFVQYPNWNQADCLKVVRGYPKQWTDGPCIRIKKPGNCNASSSINCKP